GAAGCASGPPRATTANLARAHALVSSAQQSGAQRYAAADLQRARDETQQADEAAQHGDAEQADRLASKAALDAQLASARAKNGAAQHALAAVNESLGTLRSETRRESQAPPAPSVNPAPSAAPDSSLPSAPSPPPASSLPPAPSPAPAH
ncbi:MAG: DUF4398 domain-containing protein, partial [Steroidobacteraceae bacterium]